MIDVDGSLAGGADVVINSGATLTGDGSINLAVVLNSGASLQPGSSLPGSTLTTSSVTWNGNSAMTYELGTTSNQLAVSGALTKGGVGPFNFVFTGGPGLAGGNTYTLATFGSTDFMATDFSYSGLPPGLAGVFTVTSNSILFEVFAPPVIVTQPQNTVVLMGGMAVFTLL